MSDSIQNKAQEFISRLHALETGSVEAVAPLVELYAPDAQLHNAALDQKKTQAQGHEEIAQFWTQYKETLGQVKSEFHQVTQSENAAGLFWTTSGTSPEGEAVFYHGATLLEFGEDGLISRFRGYYDTRELTIQTHAQ